MPLNYQLRNGNIVEIITSVNSNGPSRDWLDIVKSTQAKSKIRQWFKLKDKDTNAIKGKEALEKELKRQGYKVNEILREDWLKSIANKASINTVEDLYASIGYGNIRLNQVITKLKDFYSEYYRTHHEEEFLKEQTKKTQERKKI